MVEGFTRTWQRPPTREELEGLIRDRVREEVYYREALALGLDKDDMVIRRRLRQKMEFVTDDVVARGSTDRRGVGCVSEHPPSSVPRAMESSRSAKCILIRKSTANFWHATLRNCLRS